MAGMAATGLDARPMPIRRGAWAIYEVFDTQDGQLFIGVTSDQQWARFVEEFSLQELAADPRLATNVMRLAERSWLIPALQQVIGKIPRDEVASRCERAQVSWAPVGQPGDLFDDPHLLATGGLVEVILSRYGGEDGIRARLPALPIEFGADRQPPRSRAPAAAGRRAQCRNPRRSRVFAARDRRTRRERDHHAIGTPAMLPTERLDYSAIAERKPLKLPGGARLAVWVIVNVEEWDPKETMPRTVLTPPAGGAPMPDIPNWAWHEYGNRVGFWRMLDMFDDLRIPAVLAINGSAIARYEPIVRAARERNWEFIGHGFSQKNMQKVADERDDIRRTGAAIREATGKTRAAGSAPA